MPRTSYFFPVCVGGGVRRLPLFLRTSVRTSVPRPGAGRPPPWITKMQHLSFVKKAFKTNGLGHFLEPYVRWLFCRSLSKSAPMQRSARFVISPFGTGALYMGATKRSKPFKITGLRRFCLTHSWGSIWTIKTAQALPCCVALVLLFAGALPCSVALVF